MTDNAAKKTAAEINDSTSNAKPKEPKAFRMRTGLRAGDAANGLATGKRGH